MLKAHLAATRRILAGSAALHLVVICEEVGVALIAEGQAQHGLGVGCCVAFAVRHLSRSMECVSRQCNPVTLW